MVKILFCMQLKDAALDLDGKPVIYALSKTKTYDLELHVTDPDGQRGPYMPSVQAPAMVPCCAHLLTHKKWALKA